MLNTHIAGVTIVVPDPERIPVPKTRKAIERGVKAARRAEAAGRDAQEASRLRHEAAELARLKTAAILDADPDAELGDPDELIRRAEAHEKRAFAEWNARTLFEQRQVGAIREAVLDERAAWAKHAVADASTALATLALALDTAREAREALYASVGVAGMLTRLAVDPSAPIAIQHKAYGYTFDINPAIEGLEEALRNAADELDEIKAALKGSTGEKPKRARKSLSEAQGAAETAPAPVPAALAEPVAFEMGADDD
ncbi:hypothetical protein [Microbacterium sp. 1P10AE]|uniref:hypothetical protein n=1 Tax=Microbacterium sp. 1P10AE TaxID=3132286 RepID=UPI0039A0FD30